MNELNHIWIRIQRFFKEKSYLAWLLLAYIAILLIARENFFRILFYAYLLYLTGTLLLSYNTQRRFVLNFVLSSLAGLLIAYLTPNFEMNTISAIAIAMSSGVFGTLTAIAASSPQLEISLALFGRVKFLWVVLVILVLEIMTINAVNAAIIMAHLGGAAIGYGFFYLMKRGKDPSKFLDFFYKKREPKLKKNKNPKSRPLTDDEYNKQRVDEQQRIDHILEKISRSGYESLNKEEKALLFKKSNEK